MAEAMRCGSGGSSGAAALRASSGGIAGIAGVMGEICASSCGNFRHHALDGVVVHDNLLFDAASSSAEDSRRKKPATALEAAAVEAACCADSSITLLCEEVSRLFTQYNAAFKCGGGGGGGDAQPNPNPTKNRIKQQQLRPSRYALLRCVDSTADAKVLDGDIPALALG